MIVRPRCFGGESAGSSECCGGLRAPGRGSADDLLFGALVIATGFLHEGPFLFPLHYRRNVRVVSASRLSPRYKRTRG